MSALDIQSELLEHALSYRDRAGFTAEEERALGMWEHCVTALARDPLQLATKVDWVIKYRLIEAFRARHGLELSDPRVAGLDLQYHDITRSRSPFHRLEAHGRVERVCADTAIEAAMTTAPSTTRAHLRSRFIARAQERRRDYTVDWVHLKLNDQAQRTVICKDPFASSDVRVDRLIEQL